jgi:hypothetical protein
MNCQEFEESLTLLVYGEVSDEERAACEAHAASCAKCRRALEELHRLRALLAERPRREPTPELIVQCRQALEEALDREQLGWHGLVRQWFSAWHFRPAAGLAAALTLLACGFTVGWTLRPHAGSAPALAIRQLTGAGPAGSGPPAATHIPLTEADLTNMRISGISGVAPDPMTGAVRITMDAQRRVILEGSLDDPRIQQLLVYAVKSYDNPGIRRESLEALRPEGNKPVVRQALLYTMRHDPNLGVRLAALEEARGLEWGPDLQDAFLGVLTRDKNDGMRVAAVDILTGHANASLFPALQRLAASDSSPYVRMKSASAVRNLGR